MKIKTLIVSAVFSLNLIPVLCAHPPQSIVLEYFNEKKMVKITVNHSVTDASKHFVNEIQVSVNEEKLIEQDFILQYNDKTQEAIYMIPGMDLEDKIQIEAKCNKYGSVKEEFSVMEIYNEELKLKEKKEEELKKEKTDMKNNSK